MLRTWKMLFYSVIIALLTTCSVSFEQHQNENDNALDDSCEWINNQKCPDPKVRFLLFTRENVERQQLIHIEDTLEASNLTNSLFNPQKPSKIIIHGFRSNMFLTPLIEMKAEYLLHDDFNIFYVDWSELSSSFCYPAVVHSLSHVGNCTAELVKRINEVGGNEDIHLIGFSLGAQLTNYVANNLKPHYILPRITGLDPALPLFVTNNKAHKLDKSDANFVDVYHCNGLMQGQIERTGHVDFYFNNAIYQPGCTTKIVDVSGCSHLRCAEYFKESIRSTKGFFGWKCQSYFQFALGLCPFTDIDMKMAGNNCDSKLRGIFFIRTNAKSPFAIGHASRTSDFTEREQRYDDDDGGDDELKQKLVDLKADLESENLDSLNNTDKVKHLNLMKSLKLPGKVVNPKVFSISNNRDERFS